MAATMVELNSSSQAKLTWKIENFSKLNDNQVTFSDEFTVGGYKWKVFVSQKEMGSLLSLVLIVHEPTDLPSVKHRFTIISQTDRKNKVRDELESKFVLENGDRCWSSCIRLRDIDWPAKGYIMDDTCILRIKISVG